MKTTIEYATRCEAMIYENNGDVWNYANTFRNLRDAIEWAEIEIDVRSRFDVSKIYIVDSDTGEILATCEPEEEEHDWTMYNAMSEKESWYNEDIGFDPYMGCFTDDC